MPGLNYHIENEVATIVLNNPPQNRIGDQMIDELEDAINAVGGSNARALLIRAEGKNFSFGGDIVPWPNLATHELRVRFERYMAVFNRFERIPLPVVGAVHGVCFGGGLELALRADVIFAAASSVFGHPEQTLGIVTLLGGIYRIAERAGRARAFQWALTSEKVSASTMERFGIVNQVVDDAELVSQAVAFTEKAARGPTRAYAAHKTLLRAWAIGGVTAADEAMLDIAMPLFETEDVREGLASAIRALKASTERPLLDFKGR